MDEIRISHVSKSYTTLSTDLVIGNAKRPSRTRKVLEDVNLAFPAGQLSVLVGRSGCGKSTLLKMLAGKESPDKIIQDYAESTVAVADIKIAVRSQKTAKSTDFMKRAMAECDSLSVSQLSKAALSGMDAICEYLRGTAYAEGADALAESPSAFERWCDNRIIQTISPEKYHAFTIGPVIAYVIARQNEIKTVRIILSGKQNELPDDSIRERVREMYV